jgi:DNA-binding transcriptional regulator YiaG
MRFAKVIRSFRRKHGLTRSKAGAALNISPRTLESWELGVRIPADPYRDMIVKKIEEQNGLLNKVKAKP